MVKISIQGARGSFHDIVARKKFPDDSEIIESDTIHQVFEDVNKRLVDFGVLAIENSVYGSFLENYDLLLKYDVRIVSEVYLKIVLHLIALPGVKRGDIKEIYSHPMAMTEAHYFLEQHPGILRIETEDTAGSVRMIKEKNLRSAAAIGSNLAAKRYGMKILSRDIGTKNNYTRFLIISRDISYPDDTDKTSLVIQANNMPGRLYRCLKCFADEDINLSKIESRPVFGQALDYYFYLDFEKGLNTPETQRALKELSKVTSMIRILGSYRKSTLIK